MQRKNLIFDLDGTLSDSQFIICNALEKTMKRAVASKLCPKYQWTRDSFLKIIGAPGPDALQTLIPEADNECRKQVSIFLQEELKKEIELEKDLFLYPNVGKTLPILVENGHSLYVASNGEKEYVTKVLEANNIIHLFKGVYAAGTYHTKTKIELVQLILQSTDHNSVMIGDRLSDIEAGRKNGLKTIGCLYGYNPDEVKHADIKISDFIQLLNILESGINPYKI